MNIFALDLNTKTCAAYHVDKHVVKMISEYAQLLCTTANLNGFESPMKSTHMNHPSRLWLNESKHNVIWLDSLLYELHKEWRYRYNHTEDKVHKSYGYWVSFKEKNPYWTDCLPDVPMTNFKLAMPDECKSDNAVESYRRYYKEHKKHLHSWRYRPEPFWVE